MLGLVAPGGRVLVRSHSAPAVLPSPAHCAKHPRRRHHHPDPTKPAAPVELVPPQNVARRNTDSPSKLAAAQGLRPFRFDDWNPSRPSHLTSHGNAWVHWEKHKKEFPEIKYPADYFALAFELVTAPPPGTLQRTDANHNALYYLPTRNIFAVKSPAGKIRTLFRPDPAIHHYASNLEFFQRTNMDPSATATSSSASGSAVPPMPSNLDSEVLNSDAKVISKASGN